MAVPLAFMRAAPAVSASNSALGAWLRLHGYAAELEAGGIIPNCIGFDDRRWLSVAAVIRPEVDEVVTAALAVWRDVDLVVFGYDHEGEAKVRACRENGKSGGRPPKTKTEPNGKPNGNHPVSFSQTKRVTQTKPLSSPLPPSPSPSSPLPTSPDQESRGGGETPAVPGILLPPFSRFWGRAERGSNPKGTLPEALREWKAQGKPDPELLLQRWQAYLASLGNGHSMKISTWLSERGWEEVWEPAMPPVARQNKDKGPVYQNLAPRCGFHSLDGTRDQAAPAHDPTCIACERSAARDRAPGPRRCNFHERPGTQGKPAKIQRDLCSECAHVAALNRPATSEEPTPIGDLLTRGGA